MNKYLEVLSRLWNMFLDLLYPKDVTCLCCDTALAPDAKDGVCGDCALALEELEAQQAEREIQPTPGIDYAAAAYPYTAQARRLVIRLKYQHVRDAAVPLARAMAMLPGEEADLLVPIPTTKKRLRERGYNQAKVLCELIARETGMPMADALIRTDEHTAQVRLSGQSRRQNLKGVMKADARVRGKRILVIDDVYTTGSTAQEAARALREMGAESVGIFTAAKSLYKEDSLSGQSKEAR